MLISERIYKIMEEKKISQLEFAKRTGISQSTVSDWRRKGTNPSADKILIICEVLGVTPYELLAGTENRKMKEYTPYKDVDYVVYIMEYYPAIKRMKSCHLQHHGLT